MPSKRKSGGAAETPTKKSKSTTAASSEPLAVTCEAWLNAVFECIKAWLETHVTPERLLNFLLPDKKSKHAYAAFLITTYPVPDGVSFIEDWNPGRKNIALWMANWDRMASNTGHVINEKFLKLLWLVLVNGLELDPDEHAGIELAQIRPVNENIISPNLKPVPVDSFTMGFGSVGFLKGWRRFMAGNIVQLALRHLDLVDKYRAETEPAVLRTWSYCVVKVSPVTDEAKSIELSRGVTVSPTNPFKRPLKVFYRPFEVLGL